MKTTNLLVRIVSAALALQCLSANAQTPEWAWAIGSDGLQSEEFTEMAANAGGTIYAIGLFRDSFAMGGFTLDHPASPGTMVPFLLKAQGAGEVEWAIPFFDDNGHYHFSLIGLATDSENNVYISGTIIRGSAAGAFFVQIAGVGLTVPASVESSESFIAKIDPQGNGVWVRNLSTDGHPSAAGGHVIAVDEHDRIYWACLYYEPTVEIDGVVYTNVGGPGNFNGDILLSRLDQEGEFVWVDFIGNEGGELGNNMIPAPGGGVFMSSAWTHGVVHVGGLTAVNPDPIFNANSDRWIAKINPEGTADWLAHEGGPGNHVAGRLAAMPQGGALVLSPRIPNSSITLNGVVYDQPSGILATSYDSTGTLQQVAFISGTAWPQTVTTDGDGHFYIGFNNLSASFNFGDFEFSNSGLGTGDIVIAYMNEELVPMWAITVGAEENEYLRKLAFSADQGIVACGHFNSNSLAFGPHVLENGGTFKNDLFIAALDFTTAVTSAPGVQPLHLYPNPVQAQVAVDLSSLSMQQHTLRIFDARGALQQTRTVHGGRLQNLEVANLPKGSYVLMIQTQGKVYASKFIKL